jgi:hypothetical protein
MMLLSEVIVCFIKLKDVQRTGNNDDLAIKFLDVALGDVKIGHPDADGNEN